MEATIALARRDSRPWPVRGYQTLARLVTSRFVRRATTLLSHASLLLRAIVPGKLIQRAVIAWVRMEAACCRSHTPHYKFLKRYIDQFERAGTFERMRRFLGQRARHQGASRLDAWIRIGVLGTIRHELLNRALGTPNAVPPRLLMEAQLALSPGCDLTCEGCYTAEDRGGTAPRRERIAYLVDELVSCGAFAVHIIGKGEPFLSPKWANELLDVMEERPHVFFTIATHAMHIDDVLAARIGRIGNLMLLVAIDGPEEMHDARRGSGSYVKVHAALDRLRKHGAVFGYSCMVSAKSYRALTSPEFVKAREDSGCVIGIHSRYFPLTSTQIAELALSDAHLAEYRARFDEVRDNAKTMLMLDLDDVEQHTGCHSRAGESIYVDGITGQVAPCLRVPFAPDDCRFDVATNEEGRLANILSHAYFVAYRNRSTSCPSWCGANLEAELNAVGELVSTHSSSLSKSDDESNNKVSPNGIKRLHSYEERARVASNPSGSLAPARRRLPLLPPEAQR